MNVLQIVQKACYQLGIQPPATLVGNTDNVNLQIVELFNDVHTWLRNQRIWTQCKRTHTFDLEEDRQFYPLPRDFFATILGTPYDDTTAFPLIGPLSDAQFDMRQYGLVGFSPFPAYRIFGPDANPNTAGGQFQVWPIPGSEDTLSYEYQTSSLFKPQNWLPSTAYTITTSYVNANGNNYQCTTTGTSSATTAPSGQLLTPVANGTSAFVYLPSPYDTVLANTDLSMFDDDVVIAGLKLWYRDAKRQDSTKDQQRFDQLIDSAKARYYGSYRGSMSRYRRRGYTGINPQGGWDLS